MTEPAEDIRTAVSAVPALFGDRTRFYFKLPTTAPLAPPLPPLAPTSRRDQRAFDQFRHIFMRTGVVSGASGSAYLEVGGTKVMASAYGPRQSLSAGEYHADAVVTVEFKYASFAFASGARRGFHQDEEEKEASLLLMRALEQTILRDKYPKASIDLQILVLQSEGSAIGHALSCATLAVADAGILLFDLIAAASVIERNGQLILDPSEEEERAQTGGVMLALHPTTNHILQISQSGTFTAEKLLEGLELAKNACLKVQGLMRDHLLQKLAAPSSQT